MNFIIKKFNKINYKQAVIITGSMPHTNIKFSYSFLDKFSIETKVPNSNDVILRSRDSCQLILMKEIQVTSEQYDQTLGTLDYQKKLSHEQLLALVDYYPQPNLHKFVVLYEYCDISLQNQFENRLTQGRFFQENQLWSIFTSLAFGLAYLQQQNVGHGSISLNDCFLNEQGFIKISDPTCATSNPYSILKGYFYSPQILRCLIQQTGQQLNIFKSDAFSLGCCMLQLILMKEITVIFDYENGQVNKSTLRLFLDQVRQQSRVSKEFVHFLQMLLQCNDQQRPDFVELKSSIFQLLMIDGEDKMKQSSGIKSSISSLCRSKGQQNSYQSFDNNRIRQLISQANELLNRQVQPQPSFVKKQNRQPLMQLNSQNQNNSFNNIIQLPIMSQKPNVDYLFGNLKKSITLNSRPSSNFMANQMPQQQRENKQNNDYRELEDNAEKEGYKQSQNRIINQQKMSSKKKVLREIQHIQENIERIQFNLQKKRRARQPDAPRKKEFISQESCSDSSYGESSIISKAVIIKKQLDLLFKESPQRSQKSYNLQKSRNTALSNIINQSQITSTSHQRSNGNSFPKQQTYTSQMLYSFKPETPLPYSTPSTHLQQKAHIQPPAPSPCPIPSVSMSSMSFKSKVFVPQTQGTENIRGIGSSAIYSASQKNELYTDPSFLKMMQADVQQILNKRKYCGYA